MANIRVSAIVPAAGSGSRIQKSLRSVLPKPYLMLGGIPILARTLSKLQAVPEIKQIIVACDLRYKGLVSRFARDYGIDKLDKIVPGGKTRTDSVLMALRRVDRRIPYVLIHDAVRPFISSETIQRFIRTVRNGKNSAMVVGRPVVPTVKEVKNGSVLRTIDRNALWEVETPQLFDKKLFLEAYREYHRCKFRATDDASLVENLGKPVRIFSLDEYNMKITTPQDFALAEKLLENSEIHTGWGEDRHRLEKGKPLYIGGIKVPSIMGARGHSDGDALIHAIVDALLGALGLGDIGDYFPDTDKKFRGVRSKVFLKKALALVTEKDFKVINVDSTVILERPKLGALKQKIQQEIASLLGLEPERVGVKAKTAEGLGREGLGESILAHAIVNLKKVSL